MGNPAIMRQVLEVLLATAASDGALTRADVLILCERALGSTAVDHPDTIRLNYLEAWLKNSFERGYQWNSMVFTTDKSIRTQLDDKLAGR